MRGGPENPLYFSTFYMVYYEWYLLKYAPKSTEDSECIKWADKRKQRRNGPREENRRRINRNKIMGRMGEHGPIAPN